MSLDELVKWLRDVGAAKEPKLYDADRRVCRQAADAIAALRRDAERLDWLERVRPDITSWDNGVVTIDDGRTGEFMVDRKSYRDAIDAAIAASQKDSQEPLGCKDDTLVVRQDAAAHDWAEDATHENGRYCNQCCYCGVMFMGHKRRVVCKQCSTGSERQSSVQTDHAGGPETKEKL